MDFYYGKQQLRKLFIFSATIFCFALVGALIIGIQTFSGALLLCFPFLFVATSLFVYIFPPRLARIDSRSIQIDRAVPLLWCDVVRARLTYSSCLKLRQIIVFELKPRVVYPLTFMQKICKYSRFTPFSIPLYAMESGEQKAICDEISKYCKLEKN